MIGITIWLLIVSVLNAAQNLGLSLRRITRDTITVHLNPPCSDDGPIKCNPYGRPGTTLADISRDDESVPLIPWEESITDFNDNILQKSEPERLQLGFPQGCARSYPGESPVDLAKMALGSNNGLPVISNEPKEVENSRSEFQKDQTDQKKKEIVLMKPQCPAFKEIAPKLEHWINPIKWIVNTEAIIPRLTYAGPYLKDLNSLVIAKNFRCYPAKYKARIRLDDNSQAGIAFRIPEDSTNTFLAALVSTGTLYQDTGTNRVSLVRVPQNRDLVTIAVKPSALSGSEMINELVVVDHGLENFIEVFLDGKIMLSETIEDYQKPLRIARGGLYIVSGNAAFSEIHFDRL